jgi:dimeric dUTPase (all-alpha-NTP-PPase superfamily)
MAAGFAVPIQEYRDDLHFILSTGIEGEYQ